MIPPRWVLTANADPDATRVLAAELKIPLETVRSRLRLAKEALRQRIEAEPEWAELGQEQS